MSSSNAKRIFLTGISSGIGIHLSRLLVKNKYQVIGTSRDIEFLKRLESEFGSNYFKYFASDLLNRSDFEGLLEWIKKEENTPDIVIHLAGIFPNEKDDNFDIRMFTKVIDLNFNTMVYLISCLTMNQSATRVEQFISISSTTAKWPDVIKPTYAASKAALDMYMRSMRLKYLNREVCFKSIHIGPIWSEELGTKKGLLESTYEDTALYLFKALTDTKKNFYFPLYVKIMMQYFAWLPDRWYYEFVMFYKKSKQTHA